MLNTNTKYSYEAQLLFRQHLLCNTVNIIVIIIVIHYRYIEDTSFPKNKLNNELKKKTFYIRHRWVFGDVSFVGKALRNSQHDMNK